MDTIPSAFIRFPLCFALYRDIYVDMNGGISGGGISLAFDYNEDCFRELMENDDYALYSVGTRKMKLADDFSLMVSL